MISYKQQREHHHLQAHLPPELREQGWQLFYIQNHWLAWHTTSLINTIGYPTLEELISEIQEWSTLLNFHTEPPDLTPNQQQTLWRRYAQTLTLLKQRPPLNS